MLRATPLRYGGGSTSSLSDARAPASRQLPTGPWFLMPDIARADRTASLHLLGVSVIGLGKHSPTPGSYGA